MANRNQYPYTTSYPGNGRMSPSGNGRQSPPQSGGYRPQPQRTAAPRDYESGGYIPRQQRTAPSGQGRDGASQQPVYAAPTQPAERPKRELILFAVILFGIPLIGFIGLFFQPFLWGLSIVSLICLVALLFCQCFTKNVRTVICVVLLVLTVLGAVAANEMTPKQENYPQYGASALDNTDPLLQDVDTNNPAFVGFGVTPTATAPLDFVGGDGGSGDLASLEDYQTPTGDGSTEDSLLTGDPGAVTETPPANEAIAGAQDVLNAYMTQWKDRNFEEMVKYTTNTWRAGQSAPQQQLYWNHNWWILNSWTMSTQTTSPTADSVTFKVITDLSKSNSTKEPAKMEYNAIVFKEGSGWYVDPDSMRAGIAIVETQADPTQEGGATSGDNMPDATASAEAGIPSNAVLWYNSKGGKRYHAEEQCKSIDSAYYKDMKSFTYGELGDKDFKNLTACPTCNAPGRQ